VKTWGAGILAAALAASAYAGELSVPLWVTEPVGVERQNAPVTGGVPVGPLKTNGVHQLFLSDAKGNHIRAQLSPMVQLRDGTLEWVLVDFLADLKPNETKTFRLSRGIVGARAAVVKNAVEIEQKPDTVTLSNGLVKLQLSKKHFNLFDQVWIDRNGDEKFADDEAMLQMQRPVPAGAAGDGTIPALTLWRPRPNAAYATRYGKVTNVEMEDSGSVRTTVRLDGTYGERKGSTWLGWTCRVTMWAGRRDLRVLYAIRNVNPNLKQQEQVKRASLILRLADTNGSADYLVGASDIRMSRLTAGPKPTPKKSQWHGRVELRQVGPCEAVCGKSHRRFHKLTDYRTAGYRVVQFQPGKRTPTVDVGFRCDGWLALDGGCGSCLVWLRNFTHDNPKRIGASHDGTITLDLIPPDDGAPQPYYAKGGYWLGDRSHKTFEVWCHFRPEPYASPADVRHWANEYDNYIPPLPNTAKRMAELVQQMRRPLQLVSTPEWYTRTGALWGVMPTVGDERAAARAMGYGRLGPPGFRDPSWLGIDFLHYENFHYRSEWDDPRDCLVEFLRTGDHDYLRRAHSYGRNYRDFGVPRTDGLEFGERKKGRWGAGPVARWGKFCGCHNYGAGLLDLWLLTGDRSYRDAAVEYGYDHAGAVKVWGGFGGKGRGWARKMASVLATYKVTRDPKLKAWLVENCRPPIPDKALREDGRCLIAKNLQGSWQTGLCHHAVWHNWILHKDEYAGVERDDYRDQIIGIARNVAKYWWSDKLGGGPYYITFPPIRPGNAKATAPTFGGGGGGYTPTCVDMMTRGYLLTGDEALLAAATKFWSATGGSDKAVFSARLQDIYGMGSNTFWCRQLVYELAHPRADRSSPAAITDLAGQPLGGGKVKLTWTAPKDDARVAVYQVKHAPLPIVPFDAYRAWRDFKKKWTWWSAYNVASEPKPGRPGAAQQMVVDGLAPGVRYFAVRSRDGAPNESRLSNVVRVDVR
jgi:hypothetical protein